MTKALLYIRVSTKKQNDEGHSPEEQRENLIKFAEGNGFEVLEIIEDNGQSGRSADRPGFQRMMKIVRQKGCDAVIVNELNRFSRSVKVTIISIDVMREHGVDFISRKENIDTTTSGGKMLLNMMAAMAQFFSDALSERITEAHRYAEKEGRKLGQLPRGKKRLENGQVVDDEEEQKIIRLVRGLHKSGLSYPKICKKLVEQNISNKAGSVKWFPSQIQSMVISEKN